MNKRKKELIKKTLNISFAVLKTIGIAGTLAAILICPNLCQVFAPFIKDGGQRRYGAYRINEAARRLRERGLIKLVRGNGIAHYELTEDGKIMLAKYELREIPIKKPKKWDNKWRIIIFDIREKRRHLREALRNCLKDLGFKWLQDSVWIYPYPCEQIIELARTAYGVRRDAIYLICERFQKDELLAYHFGLGLHPDGL